MTNVMFMGGHFSTFLIEILHRKNVQKIKKKRLNIVVGYSKKKKNINTYWTIQYTLLVYKSVINQSVQFWLKNSLKSKHDVVMYLKIIHRLFIQRF